MKPVLLLIPGMLNTAAVWRRVTPLLEGRAEVRIADVQTQDSIAAMARDAWARIADVPDHVPVALCGFSMGGYVAIEMLARGGRPVRALGLLDSSCRPESVEGAALREKTIAAIERDFDKVSAGVAQFATDPARHGDEDFMAALRALLREIGAEAAIRQNRAIVARADHRGALAALRLPTLVMCGRNDRITPPALSEELAALMPAARLEWIDDAGHMTPIEQPARVAALLASLLDMTQGDTP
ncbi:alpha/beta fold hydrolase [Variovorax sp. PBL-E5]|uniref:alpha/beta fold hydrolase n=1 Tax=Variovorax sp. PBL-E5 TaxID=434014 RepID=UPI001315CC3A|nr:alpha/beta fold hydrolase [Variovorax sp. PBL-E5]VTU18605.1 Pimelyl-[acyl-carrier protein] methyl ester esterase [Variovorax sp. PBL-E5]